jgi:competence protein ComEC
VPRSLSEFAFSPTPGARPGDDADTQRDQQQPRRLRPTLWALGLFIVGLIIGRELAPDPVVCFSLTLLLAAVAGATRRRLCIAALALGAATLGAGWYPLRVLHTGDDDVRIIAADAPGRPITLEGIVVDAPTAPRPHPDPDHWHAGRAGSSPPTMTLDVRAAGALGQTHTLAPASGRVIVRLPGAAPTLAVGQRVRVSGLLTTLRAPTNPGQRDLRPLAWQSGVSARLALDSPALLEADVNASSSSLSIPIESPLRSLLAWPRALAGAWLDRILDAPSAPLDHAPRAPRAAPQSPDPPAALLRALLLGQDEGGLDDLLDSWSRLGLLHALSISGFHLVVMTGVALALIRLTGDRGALEPAIVAALVAIYLLIVPAEAPVLRSGIMVLALLAGEALGRRYDRLAVIALVAWALLLWRPADLWLPGFQLSFIVTGALVAFAPGVYERWFGLWVHGLRGVLSPRPSPLATLARHARAATAALLASSIVAWCASTPILLAHVGVFSPVGILASVVVVPIITLALWLGYATLLAGPLLAWSSAGLVVASWIGAVLHTLSGWAIGAGDVLDRLPASSMPAPNVPALWTILCLVGMLRLLARPWREARRDTLTLALLSISAIWLALIVALPATPGVDPTSGRAARALGVTSAATTLTPRAQVTALHIPGGRAVLVQSAGASLLIDAGSRSAGVAVERSVHDAARSLGAWRIDTMLLTATLAERASSAEDAARRLGVRRVVFGPSFADVANQEATPAHRLLARLDALGIDQRALLPGEAIRVGDVLVQWRERDGRLRLSVVDPSNPNGSALDIDTLAESARRNARAAQRLLVAEQWLSAP